MKDFLKTQIYIIIEEQITEDTHMNNHDHLEKENLYNLLHTLTVRNSDNGSYFTDTSRLKEIENQLKDSAFTYCHKEALYHAYSQVPFCELPEKILVVSSHVDFKRGTSKCFSDESDPEYLEGTYDNSITNAAIVTLMKTSTLPQNVVVVFTGDEEEEQGGASEFSDYINDELNRKAKCIVLDVTESGNEDGAIFTIENDCWNKKWGRSVLTWARGKAIPWKYVPYEESRLKKRMIQQFVDKAHCIEEEADADETETYYEYNDIRCFSFCIPVGLVDFEGRYSPFNEAMHSDKGLRVRKDAFGKYIQALYEVIWVTCNRPTLNKVELKGE